MTRQEALTLIKDATYEQLFFTYAVLMAIKHDFTHQRPPPKKGLFCVQKRTEIK